MRDELRILCIPKFGDAPVEPDIHASLLNACDTLTGMGHRVECGLAPFDLERLSAIWGVIGPAGLAWLVESGGLDAGLMTESLGR